MKQLIFFIFMISNTYSMEMICSKVSGTYNLIRCSNKQVFCYGQGYKDLSGGNFNQYGLQCFKGEQKASPMNCEEIKGTRNLIYCKNKEVTCIAPGNVTNKKGKFTPFALNCFKEEK